MNFICLNGQVLPGDQPALLASNRGYRYGDGLFETMKVINGRILLSNYHFERLFSGTTLLKFDTSKFSREILEAAILHLCGLNNCMSCARVRLSVFRGNGILKHEIQPAEFLIESWPLENSFNEFNETGLLLDIYPLARKSIDPFSNLKNANFLPYVMASVYAREEGLDDCLVLNQHEGIADSTIANVFIIKEGKVFTPSLGEGCVAGTIRKYLLEKLPLAGYSVEETSMTSADLEGAEEIFLTNAIMGIRWVRKFKNKAYPCLESEKIFREFVRTL